MMQGLLWRSVTRAGTCVAAAVLFAGCASQSPAPVSESAAPARQVEPQAQPQAAAPAALAAPPTTTPPGYYVVKKGDTLLSIALEHGQSYRDLAAWNNLENPNRIQVGQQLRVRPADADAATLVAVAKPVATPAAIEKRTLGGGSISAANSDTLKREPKGGKQPYSEEALAALQKTDATPVIELKPEVKAPPVDKPAEKPMPAADDTIDWTWPCNGKVIGSFVEGGNKGLEFAGKTGDPVLAAAPGKVILVSSALRGYGNFVIVKHNPSYLSVYAHNSRILVKEEQVVAKGQRIAEIGSSDSDQPKLHFEIRYQGKPVDPLKFLQVR